MSSRKQISLNESLTKLYIKHTTQDEYMTRKIMSFLFPDVAEYKFMRCKNNHFHKLEIRDCPYCPKKTEDVIKSYKNDKKSEVLESLEYLKSKEIKTNKDRESIHMLEMVLKNYN